ncbi:MAG TPA: D-arabinono-1,4-lactone oxidase [Pirellulales bacterium]|nr:D-arabinono-1,4-lactone oxidase [Pirellulales bacterium]
MSRWSNWSGSVKCSPREILYPVNEEEVAAIVRRAGASSQVVRVAGTGHSFTPLCASDDILLSLDRLEGVEWADTPNGLAAIHAGTKIHALGELLVSHGLALQNQGDVDVQAIAGAVSTGTHGTGPTLGSISTQVVGLRIVTATGEVLDCSPEADAEVFRAAQVSLGALGVITSVRMRLLPLYRLHEVTRREALDHCLATLDERSQANRHFEFFWYPADDCAFTKTLNPTDLPATEPLEPISNAAGGLASEERERVGNSWQIFPTVRENRFNEMEYSVPAGCGVECFLAIRDLMGRKHSNVTWPVEFRTQAADPILISAAHGRSTVAISIHQAADLPCAEFFTDAEVIFRRHEGRPHWAKMHSLTCRELADLYPAWDRFQDVRRRLDPQGRFLNAHLRRLFVEA